MSKDHHGSHRAEDRSFEVSGKISDRIRTEPTLQELAQQELQGHYGERATENNDRFINP